jgi:two-component system response regulator LytT
MDLHAVVVDDEPLALEELCYLLGQIGGVRVAGRADNGLDAVALVERLAPHVVFLDVQMPGLTGFEVARTLLGRRQGPHIVFVTAFDRYAVDAFELNAVDYLLKPVELGRLEQAVSRVRRWIALSQPVDDRLERLMHMVEDRSHRPAQIALRVEERLILVPVEEVVVASLERDTIQVVTNDVTGSSNYRTLDQLQARLDPEVFWRVHRSHLVNIRKIKEIVPWISRNYILRMRDTRGTQVPVSRSQTRRLREYLQL